MIVIISCETTGIPQRGKPLSDGAQPRIIQLAAIQFDRDRAVLNSFVAMFRRDGWVSTAGASAVHGINERRCDLYGVDPIGPLKMLIGSTESPGMLSTSRIIAGWCLEFQRQMVEIEIYHAARAAGAKPGAGVIPEKWSRSALRRLDIQAEAKAEFAGGGKLSLPDAHAAAVGTVWEPKPGDRKDAMDSASAAARVLWALVDLKKVEI